MSTAAFIIWSARETAPLDVLIADTVEVTFAANDIQELAKRFGDFQS